MNKKMRSLVLAAIAVLVVAGMALGLKLEPANPKDDGEGELSCRVEIRCDVLTDSAKVTNQAILPYIPTDGVILAATEVKFSAGESAFAVLQRLCAEQEIPMDFGASSMHGEFIKGIGNIYNGDAGEMSGWLYLVNGEQAEVSCGSYELQAGDQIVWAYSCDMGADLAYLETGALNGTPTDGEEGEAADDPDKADNSDNKDDTKDNVKDDTQDDTKNDTKNDTQDAKKDDVNKDQAGEANNTQEPPADGGAKEEAKLSCTLEIRCDTIVDTSKVTNQAIIPYIPADGTILSRTEVEFSEGESVFDVLQRTCREKDIHMEFEGSAVYGSNYIQGINYIYEFDAGDLSGWEYKVNGAFPNYGCSSYKLADGDAVVWCYTCDLGLDIGDENNV